MAIGTAVFEDGLAISESDAPILFTRSQFRGMNMETNPIRSSGGLDSNDLVEWFEAVVQIDEDIQLTVRSRWHSPGQLGSDPGLGALAGRPQGRNHDLV